MAARIPLGLRSDSKRIAGPSKPRRGQEEVDRSVPQSATGYIADRKRIKKEKAIKESAKSYAEKVTGKVKSPNLNPIIRKVFVPEYKHVDLDRNPREEEPFMRTNKRQRTVPPDSEAKSVPGKPAKKPSVQPKRKVPPKPKKEKAKKSDKHSVTGKIQEVTQADMDAYRAKQRGSG
jgi:hypothetical protein